MNSIAVEVVNKVLKTLDSERTGLHLLDSSVMDLPGYGSELIEVVLSDQNPFVGRVLGDCVAEFAQKYKVAVISCRSRSQVETKTTSRSRSSSTSSTHFSVQTERTLKGSDNDVQSDKLNGLYGGDVTGAGDIDFDLGNTDKLVGTHPDVYGRGSRAVVLSTGDTLLCLTKASDINALASDHVSFYVTSTVGSVPKPMSLYGLVPVLVFITMISLVAAEKIRMCPAALSATAFFFIGRWLKGSDIPKMVDMRLLMLMGCSVSFAAAMDKTGLAESIAKSVIHSVNPTPHGALFLVYLLTLLVTELMSNNAAAALMYPISTAMARELNLSPIPFAFVILIGATAAFMAPIGYQTHLMVWGPGGYKFIDFVKFGFVPDIIFWLVTCAITPLIYPL